MTTMFCVNTVPYDFCIDRMSSGCEVHMMSWLSRYRFRVFADFFLWGLLSLFFTRSRALFHGSFRGLGRCAGLVCWFLVDDGM